MALQNYPSSGALIVTFLDNVKRYRVNSIRGMNPTLINVNGVQMYIYIRNLSPAQLSNDNPDIWRIQLPKREEFEEIKKSDKLFLLFGYDYLRKVYTTWNPYWCKQRLNVAESCSMYSRLSLQQRVANTQKIEVMQLQNEGNVVCIPSSLLVSYLKNIAEYYPEERIYVPVGSSIQKQKKEEMIQETSDSITEEINLYERFVACYDKIRFVKYLLEDGNNKEDIKNVLYSVAFLFDNGYIDKYANIFYDYSSIKEYKHAINRLLWRGDLRSHGEQMYNNLKLAMNKYIAYVSMVLNEEDGILPAQKVEYKKNKHEGKNHAIPNPEIPRYELDQFGKLTKLDAIIIDQLTPIIRGVDYPDYELIIKKIREYYPEEATDKMTPADWIELFDSTKWQKRRGRKSLNKEEVKAIIKDEINDSTLNEIGLELEKDEDYNNLNAASVTDITVCIPDKRVLESVFDKRITSYKYFWFVAIITLLKNRGKLVVSYDDILIRMAAIAWPIVLQDGIDLGERDMLTIYLKEIQKKTYLISASSGRVVESSLSDYYNTLGIKEILSPLLNNVPYRFLSPWVKFTNVEEVIKYSQRVDFQGLYVIESDSIVIKREWGDYIESHYTELCNFAFNSFIGYAKQYNNDFKLLKLMRSGWNLA
jgi:hypothetical protein